MDELVSKKIKVISFLLMIMVVFIHSYNLDIILHTPAQPIADVNWAIQNFISNGLTRIAVPLFFIISGYLFAFKPKQITFQVYKDKMLSRFKTLFIPFIFWSLAAILLYLLLQTFPASKPFFTKKLIQDYTFTDWLKGIFYMPVAYQLWFLRDLIVLVITAPLIIWLVRKGKLLFIVVVLCIWVFNINIFFLSSEGLLFFSAGIYAAKVKCKLLSKFNPRVLLLGWILLLVIKTILRYHHYTLTENLLLKLSILVGMVALWRWFDILTERNTFYKISGQFAWASFFLYVFHEPYLTIIKKMLFYIIPVTAPVHLITYFAAPFIIISISIATAWLLKKYMFNLYSLITGNR